MLRMMWPLARKGWLVFAALFILLLIICSQNVGQGFEVFLCQVRPPWLYITGLTRYNFQPTQEEQACLDGIAERINAPGVTPSIPNIIHFAWGLAEPIPMPLILWLAIRAAAANSGPDTIIQLHYIYLNEQGPWWKDIQQRVTLVRHNLDFLNEFASIKPPPSEWHVAHKTDVLRLQILIKEGGIWLDSDAIILRPLDKLLAGNRDVIMGYEGGHRGGMANAVILAKRNAPFLKRWYQTYDHFNPNDWNYHSVVLPAQLSRTYPDEICPLSPAAFFWPLWPENHVSWMHRPLDDTEAAEVAALIKHTGGALFQEQLIYHAWSHVAKKYLADLTPERIRHENTRFNMLVRRFVD